MTTTTDGSRLGRNPFETRRRIARLRTPLGAKPAQPRDRSKDLPAIWRWTLVDVPAEAYVLALKLLLLARSALGNTLLIGRSGRG